MSVPVESMSPKSMPLTDAEDEVPVELAGGRGWRWKDSIPRNRMKEENKLKQALDY